MGLTEIFSNTFVVANNNWDLTSFLNNSQKTLTTWFNAGLLIVGLVAVAFAAWQIVSGLMSHGKKQVNWGITITLLFVGGALAASGGFDFVRGIAEGGKQTITDLGSGNANAIMVFRHYLPF